MPDRPSLSVPAWAGLALLLAAALAPPGTMAHPPGLGGPPPGPTSRTSLAGPTGSPPAEGTIGAVNATLGLYNDTLLGGNDVAGDQVVLPTASVYDPQNGQLLVGAMVVNASGGLSPVLAAIDPSDGGLLGETVLTSYVTNVTALAYDSANDAVYLDGSGNSSMGSVVEINSSTDLVDGNVTIPGGPAGLAFDPANGYLYVGNYRDSNLSIVDPVALTVDRTLRLAGPPIAIAFDPVNLDLYVAIPAPAGDGNVTIVLGSSSTVGTSIRVGADPDAIAYDPVTELVLVANRASDNVTGIATSSNTVSGSASLPDPTSIAVDPSSGHAFVASPTSGGLALGNLTSISGSSLATLAQAPVGLDPLSAVFDPSDATVYVANLDSGNLSAVNATSGTPDASLPRLVHPTSVVDDPLQKAIFVTASLGGPPFGATGALVAIDDQSNRLANSAIEVPNPLSGLAYDASNDEVYAASPENDTVLAVDAATDAVAQWIPVAGEPTGEVVDPATGAVYVFESATGELAIVAGRNNSVVGNLTVGPGPAAAAFDPRNGELYVALQGNSSVAVVDGATESVAGYLSLPTGAAPDGVAYDPTTGYLLVTLAGANEVAVVNGATDSILVALPTGAEPTAPFDDSSNGYVYVPDAGSNALTVVEPAAEEVLGTIPTGAAPIAGAYDPSGGLTAPGSGPGDLYVANEGSGTVSVAPSTAPAPTYPITFQESGLSYGSGWGVDLAGEIENATGTPPSTTITLREPNGTYPFTVGGEPEFSPAPATGNVTVAGGPATVPVRYAPSLGQSTYPVEFIESGLPNATAWTVSLAGVAANTTPGGIDFSEPNGEYEFVVANVTGFLSSPSSGLIRVADHAVSESVVFTAIVKPRPTYSVTFRESGLPAGTNWTVTFNGTPQTSRTGDLSLPLGAYNGSYDYTVSAPAGWVATPSSGVLSVNGDPVVQPVYFTPRTATSGFLGLSGDEGYFLLGGIVAAVAAVSAAAILWSRRKGHWPPGFHPPAE